MKEKKLTKKQRLVIDGLFEDGLSERAVCEKYKVSAMVFARWMADENFIAELDRRTASALRHSQRLIAHHSPFAAAKLIALAESDKDETARKACLDIITASNGSITDRAAGDDDSDCQITPETAEKILKTLARN